MAVPLNIQIKNNEPHLQDDERIEMVIDVTAKGKNMVGAAVTVTVTSGSVDPASGVADANGLFRTWFKPEVGAWGRFKITFSATKSPLTPAEESTYIIVEPKPIVFFERNTELLMGVYSIREYMLAILKSELDKDPQLYEDTGATRPPVFLNNFSYTTREFPQVIISGGNLTALRASIGDNQIGPAETDEDGTQYHIKGGINTLVVSFTAIANAKKTQEQLIDKIKSVLWGKRHWSLLHGGIVVTGISSGNETTEPWGDQLIYSANINVNLWTQWFLKDKSLIEVEEIDYDQSVNQIVS